MINVATMIKKWWLVLLAALVMASSCAKEEPPYIFVTKNAFVAPQETTMFNVLVESNSSWTAESHADWIKVYGASGSGYGSFEMVVSQNTSVADRSADVVVSCPGCSAVITVVQGSSDLVLVTPVTDFYLGADAQDFDVEYIVSCKDATVKAFSNTDWITIGSVSDGKVSLSVAENVGEEDRDGEVKISGSSDNGKAVVNAINIHQSFTNNVLDILVDSLAISSMGETIQVPVQTNAEISVKCTSDWCSAAVSDDTILISALENTTGQTREAVVTVSIASKKGKPLSKAITVTQESLAIGVTIPLDVYNIDNTAQDVPVKYILSSQDFTVEAASNAKWASIASVEDGIVLVSVENNVGSSERSVEIALTATHASGKVFSAKTTIIQTKDLLEILVPEVNVKAEGESIKIPFNANTDVTAKSSAYWCIASVEGNDVVLEASKNVGPAREAFITLSTAFGATGTIKVTQSQSSDSIDLPVTEVSAKAEGCTIRIPYTEKAKSSVTSSVEWCSVSIEDGYIVAEIDANSEENIREAYITATTEDGNSGLIHILQAAKSKDYIEILTPEVNVVSTNSTTKIPFTSNAEVQARSSVQWISVIVDGKDVVATISANTKEQPREGYITLTTEGGAVAVAHIMQAVGIPDEPNEFLNVLVDVLYATKEGASLNIPFTSSSSVSAVATVNWITLTVDKESNIVIATVEENNTGKDRNAYVILTNKNGISHRVEIIQVSANALNVVLTEFTAGYEGETKTIPYKAEGTVTVKTTEDWISASADSDNIVIEVAANEGDSEREGYVVVTDSSGNAAYIHVNQTYEVKTADELKTLVTTVFLDGYENTISVPLTSNVEGSLTVKSSSDWLTATMDGLNVMASVEENWSCSLRTGYLTVTTPEGVVARITVMQTSLVPVFEFEDPEIVLPYTESSSSSLLVSSGSWEIVGDENDVPSWLTVSPTSADGNALVSVSAGANKFASARSTTLYFYNPDRNMTTKLAVTQEGNPNGLVEFLHLGKGYDVSGKYAEEAYVKGRVLDPEKLVSGDHIADLLTPNATAEEVITGHTLSEYESNYSLSAGVSGSYCGFSASVEFNFSQHALETAEFSYATLRHMTKKQILKIYENETAADLKDCLADMFLDDIEKAAQSSDLHAAAKELIEKYGTHVVTGFSLGGVLEYSMAADASSCETQTDWGVAVEAGFERAGVGSVSTSDSYNQFDRLKNESDGFESKLVCRGGESQYTSSGYGDDAGKAAAAYVNWLSSLEDKTKWVMVDYEGSRLIPLWEFIDDSNLVSALQEETTAHLHDLGINQESSKKNFELQFIAVETTHDDGGDYEETEWELTLTCQIDNKSEERVLYDTHDRNDNQIIVMGYEKAQDIVRKELPGGIRKSGTIKLARNQDHKITIKLRECWEDDGKSKDDPEDDTDLVLSCPAGSEAWKYIGIRGDELNREFYVYDKDTPGQPHEIVMYPNSCTNSDKPFVRFIFQIVWSDKDPNQP